ncbi:hypothetical protein [Oceanobacillus oncorhynchi]|uniref:hypothetical protein n=1 Tax=Oceanobacillus oncorhynchi TaxID=545501 RepID=UPI0034D44F63
MANKNQPKKLTLTAVKADAKKTDEVVEIDFNEYNGTYFQIKLNPFFSKQRRLSVIESLREDVKEMKNKGIEFPDKTLPDYVVFLSVLEFSDFPRPSTDDIKKKIAYFYQVIETKYFEEVTEMMVDTEIQKIWQQVMQMVEMNEKLQSTIDQSQALMKNIQEKNGLNGSQANTE